MRSLVAFVLVLSFSCRLAAQEKSIKKIYTDVTDAIHAALLTKRGVDEINGAVFYNRLNTEFEGGDEDVEEQVQAEAGLSHFFIDNLSFGFLFSYFRQKEEGGVAEQTMVGPIIKKYFGRERFRPYVFTDYLFWIGDRLDGREWDVGVGGLYPISGNVGMTAQVKYGILFENTNCIHKQNRLFVGIGLTHFLL